MKRAELVIRTLIGTLLLTAIAVPLWARGHTPLIHASMAESGGWMPGTLQAKVGQPLHLRLTSDDVTHGFAVGQMDMQSVDIEPGKVTDVTLLFQSPGSYTFYCTRWCGVNHWRMRGTIEVSGPGNAPAAATPPLYARLGLDLDAPHEARVIPDSQPGSGAASAMLRPSALISQPDIGGSWISRFVNPDFYRSHSPYDTWDELRTNPALSKMSDQQIWNMVAFIWKSNTSPEEIAEGQRLYAQNCAACHGEQGKGNGVFADKLAATAASAAPGMGSAQTMMIQRPANFTDAKRMLGASPALLEGKILRGGMGTGMPSWGPIFSEEKIWKIVSYLYTFQFQENNK